MLRAERAEIFCVCTPHLRLSGGTNNAKNSPFFHFTYALGATG